MTAVVDLFIIRSPSVLAVWEADRKRVMNHECGLGGDGSIEDVLLNRVDRWMDRSITAAAAGLTLIGSVEMGSLR